MIKEPQNLEPRATKIERLEQVIEQLLSQLPAGLRMLIHSSTNLSQLFNSEDAEEKVSHFIEKTKEVLNYVENGQGPGTIQEDDQDQP